ncbi:MAG: hypothetical protein AAFY15_04250 [Cyanobacteria bacterium J06648_11]
MKRVACGLMLAAATLGVSAKISASEISDATSVAKEYVRAIINADVEAIRSMWHPDFARRLGGADASRESIDRVYGPEGGRQGLYKQFRLAAPQIAFVDSGDGLEQLYVVSYRATVEGFPQDVEYESLLVIRASEARGALGVYDSSCWTIESLAKAFPGLDDSRLTEEWAAFITVRPELPSE